MEIDLEGLREYLWEYPDGSLKDYLSEDEHDRIRWIDTSTMLCDPLTKAGGKNFADRLIKCMQTGELSLEATAESQMRKLKQQKGRQDKADEKRRMRELGGDVQTSPPIKRRKKKGKVEERPVEERPPNDTPPDDEFVASGEDEFFDKED